MATGPVRQLNKVHLAPDSKPKEFKNEIPYDNSYNRRDNHNCVHKGLRKVKA